MGICLCMDSPRTPRIARMGIAIITGMFSIGLAAMFGARMAHPSLVIIVAFFVASWGVIYLLWEWVFITRTEQVSKNVPISGAELRRRRKRFFDSLPRS